MIERKVVHLRLLDIGLLLYKHYIQGVGQPSLAC
jgi:hypothetical protein